MAGWQDVHVGPRGDSARIDGVDIWKHEWRWLNGQTITLPHPWDRASMLSFMVCEAGGRHQRGVRFAAADIGGGLWAFYVPN